MDVDVDSKQARSGEHWKMIFVVIEEGVQSFPDCFSTVRSNKNVLQMFPLLAGQLYKNMEIEIINTRLNMEKVHFLKRLSSSYLFERKVTMTY